MNFNDFYEKVLHRYIDPETRDQINRDENDDINYYHVVVHKFAFESFWERLNENIVVRFLSPLWREEHAHLIAWSRNKLKTDSGILSNSIQNQFHGTFVYNNFIDCYEERHDLVCNATFTVSPIKDTIIEKILTKLPYLHDMRKLNLPQKLCNDLFEQSFSHFYLPVYDGKSFTPNYECFFQLDYIHEKEAVVWFQNTERLNNPFPYVVEFYFFDRNENVFYMCLHCMRFKMRKGYYFRMYSFRNFGFSCTSILPDYVRDPVHWCHACKQVPLFQLLSLDEVKKQQRNKPYKCCRTMFKYPVRFDYYKDGVEIASDPLPKRIRKRKACLICKD